MRNSDTIRARREAAAPPAKPVQPPVKSRKSLHTAPIRISCGPGFGFLTRRRDGRVAEGARLESVFRGNSNVGSNPTLSAIQSGLMRTLAAVYLKYPRKARQFVLSSL